MGFEEAMAILEEYEKDVPKRSIASLGCGCCSAKNPPEE